MINIRPAKEDDINELQILNHEVFLDNSKYNKDLNLDWSKSSLGREYYEKLLSRDDACCLIAEINNKKVGYIAAAGKKYNVQKKKYIEIQNMGVSPKFRSQGIGSKLIKDCLEWARKKGFDKVYVNSYFENIGANNFYKSNGFSEIDLGLERDI